MNLCPLAYHYLIFILCDTLKLSLTAVGVIAENSQAI